MSIVVAYPVEVKQYQVAIERGLAKIELQGIEDPQRAGELNPQQRRVGVIVFGDPKPISDRDFITRGGFLRMDRPLTLLAATLFLLANVRPLFLNEDGTLSSTQEMVGAGDLAPA